jgi:hypothetical protein
VTKNHETTSLMLSTSALDMQHQNYSNNPSQNAISPNMNNSLSSRQQSGVPGGASNSQIGEIHSLY